jgi:hypothetical protein
MNYFDLTKTQKRCIDAFVKICPDLSTRETITRPEIEKLFKTLYDARAQSGVKIGYPMWLVKGEKIARGAYKFPAPKLSQVPIANTETKVEQSIVKVEEEDKEFFTDLKKYGIIETA